MIKWTKEDLEKLGELYPITPTKELSKIFRRNPSAIWTKASRLGITKDFNNFIKPQLKEIREKSHKMRGHKVWSENEVEVLKKLYPTIPRQEATKLFRCDWDAIILKASRVGLRREWREIKGRWREEEEKQLKQMWATGKTIVEIAEKLGRSFTAIEKKARALGLKGRGAGVRIRRIGIKGEKMIKNLLNKMGVKIIEEGTNVTPFDFLIRRDGEEWFVNAKFGDSFSVTLGNLKRLFNLSRRIMFLFVTRNGEMYLLPVLKSNSNSLSSIFGRPTGER